MSNLTTTNIQLPAHLADRLGTPSAIVSDMTAGITSGGFKRISIRGGRFRIREGNDETVLPDNVLRAVIVGASPTVVKTFYKGAYNPKAEEKAPDCHSNDGIRPAADAKDPQAQLCANCPQNVYGSKQSESGAKMKACADQKRIALIAANDTSDDPEVYLFQVTPSALTAFRQYGQLLASKGFPPEVCVTEIYFDTDEAYPKAQFRFGGFVDEAMVPIIDKLLDTPKVNEIIGKGTTVAKTVEQPAAPKPSPVKVVNKPVVQEIEDAEFEEVQPAPVSSGGNVASKFGGFGAASAGKSASASTVKEPQPAQTAKSSSLASDVRSLLETLQDE